ncbi:MAG: ACT domain-containing protein [Oscillospiraceae bacterium]|nr:ACT domain-containing protein [Oscillospiraceae bacterium]
MNIYQISVFLENRAGQLSEITKLLADNGINLRAISIAETSDYGVLRMIADDAERASSILLEQGNIISMTPVSVVAVPDRPAGLSEVLSIIAEAGIDIEYMYSLFTHADDKAYMVFRVDGEEKLSSAIKAHDMEMATKEEIGLK